MQMLNLEESASRSLGPLATVHAAELTNAFRAENGLIIFWIVLGVGIVMMMIERVGAGRNWPKVRGWWFRAVLLNSFQVAAVWLAGVGWNGWMYRQRLWSLDRLGVLGGALVGYVVLTFVYYWWHRWRHESQFLWKWVHQVHHSAQRIEIITSFYKHPVEILANSALSSIVLYLGLGVSATSASLAVLLSGIAELVYHWNVRTPCWLGYIFQRPESHCVHHQEGLHSYNYSDLPLWDILFHTFNNPREWQLRCGFGALEHRLPEMLIGVDVNARPNPRPAAMNKGVAILLVVGLLQMAGDVFGVGALKGFGAATGASPAPKVFSSAHGLETFTSEFVVEWTDKEGRVHAARLTPELYSRLQGPYNRRNVYGAALAYAPILYGDPRTREMYKSVVRYALCGGAPLPREIGFDLDMISGSARVRVVPRSATPFGDQPFVVSVTCE
jgi:sterol desaturase/sphingolipid hydroxylase (fatty acid hydroxylase superfamily)